MLLKDSSLGVPYSTAIKNTGMDQLYQLIYVMDGEFEGTRPLACLSLFSVMLWIRSNYLFRSEVRYSNVFVQN